MTQYKFLASNVYNCDESVISCEHKHEEVLAQKAARQVEKLTAVERAKI